MGDGNNVEEVYAIASAAVNSIREGQGPVFLEFNTYRHREHCGPFFDNHIGYRTEEEFRHWEQLCPLKTYQNQLTEQELAEIKSPILTEIQEAFEFAVNSPFPSFDIDKENPYA